MGKSYGLECPIAQTLDLLGDRWTLLLVRDLLKGKTKFKDFAESLEGIPLNLLAERLKLLEASDVVVRTFYCEHPPRAEYNLTEKGKALAPVIRSISVWGRKYVLAEASEESEEERSGVAAVVR